MARAIMARETAKGFAAAFCYYEPRVSTRSGDLVGREGRARLDWDALKKIAVPADDVREAAVQAFAVVAAAIHAKNTPR